MVRALHKHNIGRYRWISHGRHKHLSQHCNYNKRWFNRSYSRREGLFLENINCYFFRTAKNFFSTITGLDLSELRYILDVGCGKGDVTKMLNNKAIGVDIAETGLLIFKRKGGIAICANAESLPFKDNTFDMVYCNGLLHHVDSLETAFLELYRVCRNSGHLLFGPENQKYSILNYIYYTLKMNWRGEKKFWNITGKRLYHLAKEAGAININIRYLSSLIFGINKIFIRLSKFLYDFLPQKIALFYSDIYIYCKKP
jgi:ubiquinone/menaquinone biosynthesis C-methylase UbiE